MIYLSMSLIRDLLDCPKKLDFRIGEKEDQKLSSDLAEGIIVHEVLEKCWNNREDAHKLLKEELKKYSIKLDVKKMVRCIDNFFIMYSENLSVDDLIEHKFKVPYNKEVMLVGKFDRIHNNVLYDWKSGDVPPDDMNKDVQFMVYYLAYTRLFKREPSAMIYAHLQGRRNYLFKPKESYLMEFENTMLPFIISEIKKRDKVRLGLIKYGICKKCTFREACLRDD